MPILKLVWRLLETDADFMQNLKKLGVYAGNDAIVAFARLHQVNIVIHQLNAKHLMITGCRNSSAKQLHISYHNGDHYSSIRKLNDNTESPANIRIQDKSDESDGSTLQTTGYQSKGGGRAYVRAMRGCQVIEEEVIVATKCHDLKIIRETLTDCDYDADAAIAHLMQLMELADTDEATVTTDDGASLSSYMTSTDSGICSDGGAGITVFGATTLSSTSCGKKSQRVHFREDSFGGSSGYGSMSSNPGGARPKLVNMKVQHQHHPARLSGRKQKEMKKMEKKMRAGERHRQRVMDSQPLARPTAADPTAFTVMSTRTSSMTMI